jgi:adenosylmethionine-8-amino-7-oxononanoate aminotransferase
VTRDEIVALDRARVWHPFTSVDAWERTTPLVIARAEGASLYDVDGKRYLDGNSSWWVAALGHGHPRLRKVLAEQAAVLDHCAFAGITHEPAARLADELVAVAPPGLSRVFYTDNGSGAVEVAIKIALQTWKNRGKPQKSRFIALDGAYHGDTIGATSLGGVEVFRRPYAEVCFECVHAPFPAPDAYDRAFGAMKELIEREHDTIAAVVIEPIVQGAAGMRIYDARYLAELRALTQKHDVLLIVDEVFTGYGRTGKMWACEHAGITPDVMCIGKVFTTMIPMAATLVTDTVFDTYRGGEKGRALYYGHTFCGNPIGAALAREVLAIYREEEIVAGVAAKHAKIHRAFGSLGRPFRSVGMVAALDLGGEGYLADIGWRVYEEGLKRGAYLRPLGDTVYVCPPLVMSDAELEELLAIFVASVRAVVN